MLGKTCPHCGRANAVGDSPTCVYCGQAMDAEVKAVESPLTGDVPEVTITAKDQVRALLFSWVGGAALLGLLFLLGLAAYYATMVHFAPALQKKSPDEARAAVQEALEDLDKLLVEYAKETGAFPDRLSPDLAELEPYGPVDAILDEFQDGRIAEYRRYRAGKAKTKIQLVAYIPGKSKTAVILERTHEIGP